MFVLVIIFQQVQYQMLMDILKLFFQEDLVYQKLSIFYLVLLVLLLYKSMSTYKYNIEHRHLGYHKSRYQLLKVDLIVVLFLLHIGRILEYQFIYRYNLNLLYHLVGLLEVHAMGQKNI
jgi:hypothetical protein